MRDIGPSGSTLLASDPQRAVWSAHGELGLPSSKKATEVTSNDGAQVTSKQEVITNAL
jgi:hypothetical protein